ncbi:MAG: arginine--tRNA ligase [Cycloclasticus sp. symbiont of Bathymodiolus heckerae]|nr:MAG: arginine--tRNA ligase [Cycloclasticus sp. symbiont of Bathymodiolus heckerae]
MKTRLASLLQQAISSLQSQGELPNEVAPTIKIERTRDASHGDYASNVAMTLAKAAKKNPRQIAQSIIDHLPADADVSRVDIAGPGFINFFINPLSQHSVISTIIEQGARFGTSNIADGKKVQLEFVSANPTGPLHVGHGRGAAYGATLANLLTAIGYQVHREYYVNDAGRQMDILATSVWLRYLDACDQSFTFPSNGYKGDYVLTIANNLKQQHGDKFLANAADVFNNITSDEPAGGDKEKHIDALILRAKELLGQNSYTLIFDAALSSILGDIRNDLEGFGVHYDDWFSERSLMDNGAINNAIEKLKASGHMYQKDGAWWFKSTDFGDEKDRVVIRDNGQTTYFASDIAYHLHTLERGFDIIDIWGSDHHGYVPRVKAALQAMGADPERMKVLLVQFAVLYKNGEKMQMSTRSGQFVTLRELRDEIGSDAARYFYVMRKAEQHMDFDLDLATSQSNENPLFYVQYAHARVCSVMRLLAEKGLAYQVSDGISNVNKLTETHEVNLVNTLSRYPEKLLQAAQQYEPHQLTHYLRDLATQFHSYYNSHKFIIEDQELMQARLALINATKQVLHNGLNLLGVNAPESM